MFGKLMSSLGLQNASIETHIYTPDLQAGQTIEGEVILTGGDSTKTINGVSLQLMTIAEVEAGDHEFNQPVGATTIGIVRPVRTARQTAVSCAVSHPIIVV